MIGELSKISMHEKIVKKKLWGLNTTYMFTGKRETNQTVYHIKHQSDHVVTQIDSVHKTIPSLDVGETDILPCIYFFII